MTEKVPFSATDRRHSYIQRPHSLAGPGAYSIPSTFCQNATNTLLRAVQREHYGREFARMKRNAAASSPAINTCTGAAPLAATAAATTAGGIAATGDAGAFALDDAPPNADANSTAECAVSGIHARQPGSVTADTYRRRRDQLRSQVVRQVAAPDISARSIPAATTVPPSPSPINCTSCYDAYVDGYVPATADGDDRQSRSPPAEAPAMLPPPPPIQQLSRAGDARGQRKSSNDSKGRGAPPGSAAASSSYGRYLASTGYLKRLTRHRQRCLGDAAD